LVVTRAGDAIAEAITNDVCALSLGDQQDDVTLILAGGIIKDDTSVAVVIPSRVGVSVARIDGVVEPVEVIQLSIPSIGDRPWNQTMTREEACMAGFFVSVAMNFSDTSMSWQTRVVFIPMTATNDHGGTT
jgi:hypothetical protein